VEGAVNGHLSHVVFLLNLKKPSTTQTEGER
jgi:hypothetical protein